MNQNDLYNLKKIYNSNRIQIDTQKRCSSPPICRVSLEIFILDSKFSIRDSKSFNFNVFCNIALSICFFIRDSNSIWSVGFSAVDAGDAPSADRELDSAFVELVSFLSTLSVALEVYARCVECHDVAIARPLG